jgi:hypothetical protein
MAPRALQRKLDVNGPGTARKPKEFVEPRSRRPTPHARSIDRLYQISNLQQFAITPGIVFRGDNDVPVIHLKHSYIVHQSLQRTIGRHERAALQARSGFAFVRSRTEQERDSGRAIAFPEVTLNMAQQIGRQNCTYEALNESKFRYPRSLALYISKSGTRRERRK